MCFMWLCDYVFYVIMWLGDYVIRWLCDYVFYVIMCFMWLGDYVIRWLCDYVIRWHVPTLFALLESLNIPVTSEILIKNVALRISLLKCSSIDG